MVVRILSLSGEMIDDVKTHQHQENMLLIVTLVHHTRIVSPLHTSSLQLSMSSIVRRRSHNSKKWSSSPLVLGGRGGHFPP
jgi:hypothetical protein